MCSSYCIKFIWPLRFYYTDNNKLKMSESPISVQIPGPAADYSQQSCFQMQRHGRNRAFGACVSECGGVAAPLLVGWLVWTPCPLCEQGLLCLSSHKAAWLPSLPGGLWRVPQASMCNFPFLLLPSLRILFPLRNPCCFIPDWLSLSRRTCLHLYISFLEIVPCPRGHPAILYTQEGYLEVAVFGIKVRTAVPSLSFRSLFIHTSLHTVNPLPSSSYPTAVLWPAGCPTELSAVRLPALCLPSTAYTPLTPNWSLWHLYF